MAVSFEPHGRLHYLDPGGHSFSPGDWVLVPTEGGPEVAQCVWPATQTEWAGELPVCAGPATEDDLLRDAANRRRRAEIAETSRRLIAVHDLPMKVVAVDFLDRSRDFDQLSVIYFEAPHRVDFRALIGDLARALRSRVDLRQIGARDAAALVGGIGGCGRELCCALMRLPVEPISLRMAKIQDLPANPLQISGACGRLMCCIAYEHPLYVDFQGKAPGIGTKVRTPHGDGVVVGHAVPADQVLVRTAEGVQRCPLADACPRSSAAPSLPRS